MAKTAAPEKTIPLPIVVLMLLVAVGMAGAGMGKHESNRRGTFEVTFEWHIISGGVNHVGTRNGAEMFRTPRVLTTTGKRTYRFPGKESDRVVATMKGLRDFDAEPTSYMFVSIIFDPTDGYPTLPSFSRDATPTQSGVHTTWP